MQRIMPEQVLEAARRILEQRWAVSDQQSAIGKKDRAWFGHRTSRVWEQVSLLERSLDARLRGNDDLSRLL